MTSFKKLRTAIESAFDEAAVENYLGALPSMYFRSSEFHVFVPSLLEFLPGSAFGRAHRFDVSAMDYWSLSPQEKGELGRTYEKKLREATTSFPRFKITFPSN